MHRSPLSLPVAARYKESGFSLVGKQMLQDCPGIENSSTADEAVMWRDSAVIDLVPPQHITNSLSASGLSMEWTPHLFQNYLCGEEVLLPKVNSTDIEMTYDACFSVPHR